MKKLLIIHVIVFVATATNASTFYFYFTDPMGDHAGRIDVVGMNFSFDTTTGAYTIVLTAHPDHPFVGEFRINVNLFNPDTGATTQYPSYFRDTMNEYELSSPVSELRLTGTHESLTQWKEGDRVAISQEPFGNPDHIRGFSSSVLDLPIISGWPGDTIGSGELCTSIESSPITPRQTLHVPGEYSTLRAAILAARSGDQIEVAPGTYHERIHFDGKALHLYSRAGAAVTTIHGGETGTVVYCNGRVAADTILEGFTITGGDDKGGMFNFYASPTVINCVFTGNHGSGMRNHGANPVVIHSTFIGNSAYIGGGMCNVDASPIVTNCTFEGNAATDGGAMFNSNSNPIVINCTFHGNHVEGHGGAVYNSIDSTLTMINGIVWGNGPDSIQGPATISYSTIEGGWLGEGNIDTDPLFVAETLHLSAGSPCIDAGNNAEVPANLTMDLDGNPRIVDGNDDGEAVVDMGAYEYTGTEETHPVTQ